MKNIFLAVILSVLALKSSAQNEQEIPNRYRYKYLGVSTNGTFRLPYGTTHSFTNDIDSTRPGALFYRTTDSSLLRWTGTQWLVVGGSGGGGGGGFKLVLSSSAPADTTVLWATSSINILDCFPIRYYVQGAWSNLDTIGGIYYDSVAHAISYGRPVTIAATGQSNIIGPTDPSYPYYGDTIPTPLVAAWDPGVSKYRIAKIHSGSFASTNGCNYVLATAKRISRYENRSVRIAIFGYPGNPLNCWSGNMGERPDTAYCYGQFTSILNASKIKKPDLFIWGQGEAGANGVGADYYTMWVRMMDSLRRQGYMDSLRTLTLWMGTGDPSGQSINTPTSGGDRGGRRIGNDNDVTTVYVPSRGAQQVNPHFTPLGHEQMGERAFNAWLKGTIDSRQQILGYNGISQFKNTDDSSVVVADGLYFANAAGKPFVKMYSNDVRYCDANASGITGLRMQRFSNSLSITDYAGGTLYMPGDNKLYWTASGGIDANRFTARTGADPKFILFDAITGLAWNITNLSTTNLFRIDYNGSNRFSIRSTGQIGIGTSSPSNNAAIDAGSTGRGFIPGKLTGAQAEALTLTSGDEGIIFRITNGNGSVITSTGWWGWNDTTWEKLNNDTAGVRSIVSDSVKTMVSGEGIVFDELSPDSIKVSVDTAWLSAKIDSALARGPKIYEAIILQDGTDDPTVSSELRNDFGITPTIGRASSGTYYLRLDGMLDVSKTICQIQATKFDDPFSFRFTNATCIDSDKILITARQYDTGTNTIVPTDSIKFQITIKRYP